MFEHDYLMHYGIKGQKWGVRRYQNSDGSLTTAGRARYSKSSGNRARYGSARYGGSNAGGTNDAVIEAYNRKVDKAMNKASKYEARALGAGARSLGYADMGLTKKEMEDTISEHMLKKGGYAKDDLVGLLGTKTEMSNMKKAYKAQEKAKKLRAKRQAEWEKSHAGDTYSREYHYDENQRRKEFEKGFQKQNYVHDINMFARGAKQRYMNSEYNNPDNAIMSVYRKKINQDVKYGSRKKKRR